MREWIKTWTKSVRVTFALVGWFGFSGVASVIGYIADDMARAEGIILYAGTLTIVAMILILVSPSRG